MSAPLPVEKRGDCEQKDRRQKGPDHGSGHAARPEAGILRCRCWCCVLHGSLQLARAHVRLSRIFSRGFNRSRRSYLPPQLALPLSLSISFSFSLFFFVVSSIWSHSFARANRSVRTKSDKMLRKIHYRSRPFFFFIFSFRPFFVFYQLLAECENLKAR